MVSSRKASGFVVPVLAALLLPAAPLAQAQGRQGGDAAWEALSVPADKGSRKHDPDDAKLAPDAPRFAALAAATVGDYRIDALLSSYRWYLSTITYSFYEDDVFHGVYYGSERNVREVSEPVKTNVRQIVAWYGTLLNLNFVEVTETSANIGMIRFMLSDTPSYAYAYYPSGSGSGLAGDVLLNSSYDRLGDTNGFQHPAGQHGYVSLIHEIGHTLGLKHPHEGYPTLPTAEDNESHTVMTYNFTGYSAGTPMGYDLMALQYLYGGRESRSGNDSYLFAGRGSDQYTDGGTLYLNTPYHTRQTIWDTGGFNSLDCSGLPYNSSGYVVDLNGLGRLVAKSVDSLTDFEYGTVLANGSNFQDVINSSSSDSFYANSQPNVFKGYSKTRSTGNDVIYGATMEDTLDLSGYSPSDVSSVQNGSDRVLTLGSNGSVTIKGYYAGNPIYISYAAGAPAFSISSASVNEGNSGTVNVVFTVTLSTPSSSATSVDYNTQDGTASTNDYAYTAGTLTFDPGVTTRTITVPVNGDSIYETNEVFYVNLANPTGGAIVADGQGAGTIMNDDAEPALAIPAMSPQNATLSRSTQPTVPVTATVVRGGAPVGGATVVFTMDKPGKKQAKFTSTTNASGVATWSYPVGRRDALGLYSVSAHATYGSQAADSLGPATFTLQ